MIIKNKNFYVFHIIPRIPRRTSFKSKTPWKILIVEGNGQKGPGSPSKISFGPFKKFFAQLAVLLRGERAFSRITFVELSYRKSGGGSAIFVQLGCIHHRPLQEQTLNDNFYLEKGTKRETGELIFRIYALFSLSSV